MDYNKVPRFGDANRPDGIPYDRNGKIDSPLVKRSHYRVVVSDTAHLVRENPDPWAMVRLLNWFRRAIERLENDPPREVVTWEWPKTGR